MYLRFILSIIGFCLVATTSGQTVSVNFDVDFSVGGGNKKVTVSYCATGDFIPADGSDDWGSQWLTIGFTPATGITPGQPSSQLSGFSSNWLPFMEAFGAGGGQINTFTPSQVGGADDGNVYIAFQIAGSTPNKPLADGACQNVFEFLIPLENGVGDPDEMFLLDESGIPGAGFAFEPNIQNNGIGANVYDGVEPQSSLPIELSYFEVTKLDKSTELNWTTASEINASHFEIERSQDGNNWTYLGEVEAVGESSVQEGYSFLDNTLPLNTREDHKIFYYRLKLVDNDGSFDYSDVRSVRFDFDGEANFLVYPNPTVNEVYVNLSSVSTETGPATLQVLSVDGQLVKQVQLNTSDDLRVNISNLTPGAYNFVARHGAQTYIQKVLKIQ